jgi:hypothetical protein
VRHGLTTKLRQTLPTWRKKLLTWRKFQSELPNYTETDLLVLLDEERSKYKRVSMLERIHQRYNTLRVARERVELLKIGKRP